MSDDTGPVNVDKSMGITPEQYQTLVEKMRAVNNAEYRQKADQLMINLLSEIRDDMKSTRGWVVFMGVTVLLSLIVGILATACGLV